MGALWPAEPDNSCLADAAGEAAEVGAPTFPADPIDCRFPTDAGASARGPSIVPLWLTLLVEVLPLGVSGVDVAVVGTLCDVADKLSDSVIDVAVGGGGEDGGEDSMEPEAGLAGDGAAITVTGR